MYYHVHLKLNVAVRIFVKDAAHLKIRKVVYTIKLMMRTAL